MPMITTTVECDVPDSFRVQQVAGMFDVPLADRASETFSVEVPSLDEPLSNGAIVGPSGSGKSTLARAIMQLTPLAKGRITFTGTDLNTLSRKELRAIRTKMQMIFQDPGGSLNEFMRVGQVITEPLLVHGVAKGEALKEKAKRIFLKK